MRVDLSALLLVLAIAYPASAQTIYPLDRSEILAGARFDLKVEFPDAPAADAVEVTINGRPAAGVLGGTASFVQKEEGLAHSAYWLRGATVKVPGHYRIAARHGSTSAEVRWEVFATPPAVARNVILFVGDGMSNAHRVAARILSKGIREGRYGGELAIDDMPHMALVSTAGSDSIITDSANSAMAYTTGHKSCTNALGVYCAANKNPNAHPNIETIAALARRLKGMSVGIVTNTEVQDATPASMVAHVRRRLDYDTITRQLFEARPEVLLGGGSASFLPAPKGRRQDGLDYLEKFQAAGYKIAATAAELTSHAADPRATHLLGLFNSGNMDGALDRRFLKKGTTDRFPEQPDLVEQLQAALAVLSRGNTGFVLLVESGMIDKYTHALDWERAVYDTIMLDNTVRAAKAWAEPRRDTLIAVVADHTHPVSIVGTYDDARPGNTLRDKLGVYNSAGFPNYPAADAAGYPPSVDVSRRIAFVFSAFPDFCDAGKPHLANVHQPTVPDASRTGYVINEKNCQPPGALRRTGNLPLAARGGVHSGEDVILTATGPGAEGFRGRIDNTRVFRVLATALGLGTVE